MLKRLTLDTKQVLALVVILLVLFSAAAGIHPVNYTSAYTPYIPHYSTIYIWDNGTVNPRTASIQYSGNRYILTGDVYGGIAVQKSGVVIDGNGHKIYGYRGTGLLLQNVTDVTVQNLSIMYFSYGIYLDNVNSSTLKGNVLVNCGIELFQSNNNKIIENNSSRLISAKFSNNTKITGNVASGVSVTWSRDVTVGDNVFADAKLGNATSTSGVYTEGISIDNSDNCNVYNNTVERKGLGINIWYSTNLTFTNNSLRDNQFGFKLLGGSLHNYLQNIDTSNTVNGKPVYFLVNKTNYQVPSDAGWIAVVNSKNITVQGWTSTPNWDGVLFAYTLDSKITNSNIKDNFNALKLSNASNCIIAQNILSNSQYAALYFEDAAKNTIIQNDIIDNLCFFYIWGNSSGNTIFRNNFVGNWTGSINRNLNTKWDNYNEGNYWSCFTGVDRDKNGISEIPFLIDVESGEKDLHPRLTPYSNSVSIPAPAQTADTLLAMPEETINYTITNRDGVIWAIIDGTYPMHMISTDNQPLSLFYPIPPNTINIQVKLDGRELSFSNYSEIDPKAMHYTDIGNWQMIHCDATPTSEDFLLEIHYEHPVEIINGSHTFLYDLNILPYLSPSSINSIAHFNVRLEENLPELHVYATGFTGKWTPLKYSSINDGTTTIATFDVVSEYGKPLIGDIAFILSDSMIPEFSTWAIILALAAIAGVAIISNRKAANKHNEQN